MKTNLTANLHPKLIEVFKLLHDEKARPIIVGGMLRDFLMGKYEFKDIDIEVYGIELKHLKKLLSKFGKVSFVGKSFGVLKIQLANLEYDFSIPRTETKTGKGHTGFKVLLDPTLEYQDAFSRRDFTINAIGFDPINQSIIDPFMGINDIKTKTLRVLSEVSFQDDPLRILRAVQFSARFGFSLDQNTFRLIKKNISLLEELPRERIFIELEKLFLKASSISIGLNLLYQTKALAYIFPKLKDLNIDDQVFKKFTFSCDKMSSLKTNSDKENISLFFCACFLFLKEEKLPALCDFFERVTIEKTILNLVNNLAQYYPQIKDLFKKQVNVFELQKLAIKSNLSLLLILLFSFEEIEGLHFKNFQSVQKFILDKKIQSKIEPLLSGSDLIRLGYKPSKTFKKILDLMLDLQIEKKINSQEEAINYVTDNFQSIMVST